MNKNDPDKFESIDYKLNFLKLPKWILSLGVFFLLTLFMYFPIGIKIDNTIHGALKSIPDCSISMKNYALKLFFPRVVLSEIKLPKRCIGGTQDLLLKEVSIYFRGLSFSPFGPVFKVETTYNKNPLSVFFNIGMSSIAIKIKDNNLNLRKFSAFIPKVKLAGTVNVNGLLLTDMKSIKEIKLSLVSKDFLIPSQKISGFKLSSMKVNSLLLQAETTGKNKLKLKKFVIGDEEAPIRANFSGKIKLNDRRILNSTLDLTGELAFSKEFEDKYSLILLFMNKFDKKDNFYQIRIKGPLASPKTSSPR